MCATPLLDERIAKPYRHIVNQLRNPETFQPAKTTVQWNQFRVFPPRVFRSIPPLKQFPIHSNPPFPANLPARPAGRLLTFRFTRPKWARGVAASRQKFAVQGQDPVAAA
jgi:hypothetical protein